MHYLNYFSLHCILYKYKIYVINYIISELYIVITWLREKASYKVFIYYSTYKLKANIGIHTRTNLEKYINSKT